MNFLRRANPLFPLTAIIPYLLACACSREPAPADVLLFEGQGTSPADVAAVERILDNMKLSYATVSSLELNAMSDAQLRSYRLLVVPGGNFKVMGNSLSPATVAAIRGAVNGGMNYLGICAGAFIAGNSPYNGLNLTAGVRFPFYAAESRGVRKQAVVVTIAGASPMEQYWEDGPELDGWGEVVAKFDDGTAAVTQGKVGNGWVVLLGTHPEAPPSWHRGLAFKTDGAAARAYAAAITLAALHGAPLQHF